LATSSPSLDDPSETLSRLASAHDCDPGPNGIAQLGMLAALIVRWNRKKRMVGTRDPEEILTVHLADALALGGRLQRLARRGESFLDVGSGAGLPGLAVAVLVPALRCSLCEVSEKRVAFLHHARRELGVEVNILHEDVERLCQRGARFHHVVSRAVFDPLRWVEVARRCVEPRGRIWAMVTQRQLEAEPLGGQVHSYSVAGPRERRLVCLEGPGFT
jgi:16S rRNA (guanine527-N7)-methyltransferase